jgi:hypothetical protein
MAVFGIQKMELQSDSKGIMQLLSTCHAAPS